MGILYFNANTVLIKQYVNLEAIRVQKVGFWIWSSLQTRGDMRGRMSEFVLERATVLR